MADNILKVKEYINHELASFKVKSVFNLNSIKGFVIAGEITSGTINKGMLLNYSESPKINLKIGAIEFLDKIVDGKWEADVALVIKYKTENKFAFLNRLDLIGKTFKITQ